MLGEAIGIASSADIYGPSAGPTSFQAQEKAAPTTSQDLRSTAADSAAITQVNLLPNLGKVNPLLWLPIGLGVLVLLKLLREWGTSAEHFKTLKVDFYWFIMTVGAGVVGIPLVKAFFNKYKVNGLTEYVNNA